MDILEELSQAVVEGRLDEIEELTDRAVKAGRAPTDIIDNGLIKGMGIIAEMWRSGEIFVPEVLRGARAVEISMGVLRPLMVTGHAKHKGVFVIGTVKGDLHDIGKNIVSIMVEGAGYKIMDLGVNVPADRFVRSVKENKNVIALGMSALLTTTMPMMADVVKALEKEGIRNAVKVFVGGAPVTQAFANEIGADFYADDAAQAVDMLNSLQYEKEGEGR